MNNQERHTLAVMQGIERVRPPAALAGAEDWSWAEDLVKAAESGSPLAMSPQRLSALAQYIRHLEASRPSPAPAVEEALREAIAFVVRGPNQAHAYHECRYCGQTWWDDKEYHSRTCKVPSWRALLTQTREEGQG